ncbi:MAG: ribose-phosphate diphosphokinase [Candidatus Micrarchaeota archaeon]
MIIAGGKLAGKIAQKAGARFAEAEQRVFPDGELQPRFSDVKGFKGEHAAYCPDFKHGGNPNDYLLSFLLGLNALRTLEPAKITAVMPYLVYARQDKSFRPGEPESLKWLGAEISKLADEFVTVNSHVYGKKNFQDYFSIPAKDLSAFPLLGEELRKKGLSNAVFVAPDNGALKITGEVRDAFDSGCESFAIEKSRSRETGELSMSFSADLTDKTAVLVDDMVASGGTLVKASGLCRDKGASKVVACFVHGVFPGNAIEILDGFDSFLFCNTIASEKANLDVAPLLANALK